MKTFLYSMLLSTFLLSTAWATSPEAEVSALEDQAVTVEVEHEDVDAAEQTGKELEHKIKRKVLSIISDIIDAADEELTEEERAEAKEEIKEAIREIEEISDDIGSDEDMQFDFDDESSFGSFLVPIVAIFFIFGTPMIVITAVLYFSYRKKRLMHDTINQYVSSGKDIPEDVLKGMQKEATPKSNLHKGLVMSGIGLGIFACFAIIGSMEAAALGLIPLFIGLAQLLIWKLETK